MDIQLAICDDEDTQRAYLEAIVRDWARRRNHSILTTAFDSAEAFMFEFEGDRSFHILLLDIQMKNMDGITLAKKLRETDDKMQIIFISGFADFIGEGYEVSALHYLMKPVNEQKLFTVLDRAVTHLSKADRVLFLPVGGENIRVLTSQIMLIESFAHVLQIKTKDGSLTVKMPIYEFEQMLGQDFVRCHRSYIVGLRYIKKITKTDVILDDDQSIPLSRRLYQEVSKSLLTYITGAE